MYFNNKTFRQQACLSFLLEDRKGASFFYYEPALRRKKIRDFQ